MERKIIHHWAAFALENGDCIRHTGAVLLIGSCRMPQEPACIEDSDSQSSKNHNLQALRSQIHKQVRALWACWITGGGRWRIRTSFSFNAWIRRFASWEEEICGTLPQFLPQEGAGFGDGVWELGIQGAWGLQNRREWVCGILRARVAWGTSRGANYQEEERLRRGANSLFASISEWSFLISSFWTSYGFNSAH